MILDANMGHLAWFEILTGWLFHYLLSGGIVCKTPMVCWCFPIPATKAKKMQERFRHKVIFQMTLFPCWWFDGPKCQMTESGRDVQGKTHETFRLFSRMVCISAVSSHISWIYP
jgi:hypothetical protein